MKNFKQILVVCFCVMSSLAFAQVGEKIDPSKDYVITITTSFGKMTVLLFDQAPLHKANFVRLAKSGFYDSTTFHRIIQGFMIQGGDSLSKDKNPMNDGMGDKPYTIPAEFVAELKHQKGSLAAARKGEQVNPQRASNGSQFYIVCEDNGASHLNGAYTVFGQVVDGLDVIGKIAEQATDPRNRPEQNIYITMTVEEWKKDKIIKKFNAKSFYK